MLVFSHYVHAHFMAVDVQVAASSTQEGLFAVAKLSSISKEPFQHERDTSFIPLFFEEHLAILYSLQGFNLGIQERKCLDIEL